MGMITLLTGQADPDPARFAKSPDGDDVYIESFEDWDEKNSVPDDFYLGDSIGHATCILRSGTNSKSFCVATNKCSAVQWSVGVGVG